MNSQPEDFWYGFLAGLLASCVLWAIIFLTIIPALPG